LKHSSKSWLTKCERSETATLYLNRLQTVQRFKLKSSLYISQDLLNNFIILPVTDDVA